VPLRISIRQVPTVQAREVARAHSEHSRWVSNALHTSRCYLVAFITKRTARRRYELASAPSTGRIRLELDTSSPTFIQDATQCSLSFSEQPHCSTVSRRRRIVVRTVAAAVVFRTQAPPAIRFRQRLHSHMPTAFRFTASFAQNGHVYLACWVISIFFTVFRSDAPYLVPYLPQMPTFRVRLPIACNWNCRLAATTKRLSRVERRRRRTVMAANAP